MSHADLKEISIESFPLTYFTVYTKNFLRINGVGHCHHFPPGASVSLVRCLMELWMRKRILNIWPHQGWKYENQRVSRISFSLWWINTGLLFQHKAPEEFPGICH